MSVYVSLLNQPGKVDCILEKVSKQLDDDSVKYKLKRKV